MPGHAITTTDDTVIRLGSIEGSMRFLEQQTWWPRFRERRRTAAQMIDDVLWVGHFCGWLQRRGVAVERCGRDDLDAYLEAITSFRPGPRRACQRTVTALIDFLADARTSD